MKSEMMSVIIILSTNSISDANIRVHHSSISLSKISFSRNEVNEKLGSPTVIRNFRIQT